MLWVEGSDHFLLTIPGWVVEYQIKNGAQPHSIEVRAGNFTPHYTAQDSPELWAWPIFPKVSGAVSPAADLTIKPGTAWSSALDNGLVTKQELRKESVDSGMWHDKLRCPLIPEVTAFEIGEIRLGIFGVVWLEALSLFAGQLRCHSADHVFANQILECKDVRKISLQLLCPVKRSVAHAYNLDSDPNSIS